MPTFSTETAAKYLGVEPKRIRELIKQNRLQATQHPTSFKWEVTGTSLKKYIKTGKKYYGKPRNIDGN